MERIRRTMTRRSAQAVVRQETPSDEGEIHALHTVAFGGPTEAAIVGALRKDSRLEISLVAQLESTVVGHIAFSPVSVDGRPDLRALGLGPMAVLPAFQRRGIGSLLVSAGLEECTARGVELVVVLGHPEYYPRFGFRPAAALGLRYQSTAFDPAFFVRELRAEALVGLRGFVRYHVSFDEASHDH